MYALRARLSDGFEVALDGEFTHEQAAINAADSYITHYSDPCGLGVYVQQVAIIDLELLKMERTS